MVQSGEGFNVGRAIFAHQEKIEAKLKEATETLKWIAEDADGCNNCAQCANCGDGQLSLKQAAKESLEAIAKI